MINILSGYINTSTLFLITIVIFVVVVFVRRFKRNKYSNDIGNEQSDNNNNYDDTEKNYYNENNNIEKNYSSIFFKADYLLTYYELDFFKLLLPIANKHNFYIFSKVRLADIVKVRVHKNYYSYSWFNKIKAKHIDFVLCDTIRYKPLILIELNDSSHYNKDVIERDRFVKKLMEDLKIPLLQIWHKDIPKLEELINNALQLT